MLVCVCVCVRARACAFVRACSLWPTAIRAWRHFLDFESTVIEEPICKGLASSSSRFLCAASSFQFCDFPVLSGANSPPAVFSRALSSCPPSSPGIGLRSCPSLCSMGDSPLSDRSWVVCICSNWCLCTSDRLFSAVCAVPETCTSLCAANCSSTFCFDSISAAAAKARSLAVSFSLSDAVVVSDAPLDAKAADAEFAEHVTSGDPNIPRTAQSYVHVHIRMCTPNCAPPRARTHTHARTHFKQSILKCAAGAEHSPARAAAAALAASSFFSSAALSISRSALSSSSRFFSSSSRRNSSSLLCSFAISASLHIVCV